MIFNSLLQKESEQFPSPLLNSIVIVLQERLSHGISGSGFGGAPRSDFQHPFYPPPFPQQTAQDVFAQNPHLAAAAADPYNVNSLHSFQNAQVSIKF